MVDNRARFVLLCQQTLALAVVVAFAVSGLGVAELRIVGPGQEAAAGQQPAPGALVSSEPVEPEVRTVPLDGVDRRGLRALPGNVGGGARAADRGNVLSAPQTVSGYATVGLTWAGGAGLTHDDVAAELRTKTDGTWSQWQEMHYDENHQADPSEGESLRDGTEPVVVGAVDRIQVRVVTAGSETLPDLALSIIDPGETEVAVGQPAAQPTAAPDADAAALAAAVPAARSSVAQPAIFTRAQWGADERMRDKKSLRYGTINAGFVHHTVNANDYTKAQVPAIIRGIYAFHTKSRGWSDVGYNFLVDRFGQIWEGRYGGIDKAVVGAHTLGYNDYAFAMSAIGNFDTTKPPAVMLEAYGALMAWKLSLHGVDASSSRQKVGKGSFAAISGHRDAGSTACPGRYLYDQLPTIRKSAAGIQKKGGGVVTPPTPEPTPDPTPQVPAPKHPTTVFHGNVSGSKWPDLVVRDAVSKRVMVVRTGGQTGFGKAVTATKGWKKHGLIAAPGDVTGDGWADLVSRDKAGLGWTHWGSATGDLRGAVPIGKRLAGLDLLTGVGDLDADGKADLVGRETKTDRLVLLRGRGEGRFTKPLRLGIKAKGHDLIAGVDDFDGDGRRDLVARIGAELQLLPGTADGGLGKPTRIPGDWSAYDLIAGRGDATGDGNPDLLVRDAQTGHAQLLPGDGTGGVGKAIGGWKMLSKMRWIALGGKMLPGKMPDVVGVKRGGKVLVRPHNGRRNVIQAVQTNVVADKVDLLINAGDWNGDGRADLMTRESDTGVMHFHAGRGKDTFAAPVVAGTGWQNMRLVTPVGDVTGDGYPDLMATTASGALRIYPSNGTSGFAKRVDTGRTVEASDQVSVGSWGGATPRSAVRRTDGTLWLLSPDGVLAEQLAAGLERYDWVRGLGDLDGDGRADLVVRERGSGDLYLLPGQPQSFGSPRLIGDGFDRYDLG